MPRQNRRVVITGIGPIAPAGLGVDAIWAALLEGRSCVGPCSIFDISGFRCPFVAQLPADRFDVKQVVPKSYRKATKVMSGGTRFHQRDALAGSVRPCTVRSPSMAPSASPCAAS